MAENIFISYRRDDASGYAHAIYNKLCGAMGEEHVFMDVHDIDPGVDFVDRIEKVVSSCDVLIALIGKKWLSASIGPVRRLDDPNDFVRLEVATALKRNIRVVPILVDDAVMPKAEELPDNLKLLARRNALMASITRFNDDIDRLIEKLSELLKIKLHDKPDDSPDEPPSLPIGLWLATIGYTLLAVVLFMNTDNIAGSLFLANAILLIVGSSIASLGKVKLWLVPLSAAIAQCAITISCFFLILGDPVVVAFINLVISLLLFLLGRFYYKKAVDSKH